jgi:hypothetical protein
MAGDILVVSPVFFIRMACERHAPFADAGKAVRTGHSGAAVSGHRPPFVSQTWNKANREQSLVKAEARSGKAAISNFKRNFKWRGAAGNPESEHLAANMSSDPPSGGARVISSNQ